MGDSSTDNMVQGPYWMNVATYRHVYSCVSVYLLGGLQLRVQQCGGSSLRRDGSLLAVARRDGSAITQRRPVSQQLIKLSLHALPDYLIGKRRTS